MRLESDQHGPRQAKSLLSTTPVKKGLIMVVKEVQLLIVFIMPAVVVAYCSCPFPPLLSFPLDSALSPLVVRLMIFGRLVLVLSGIS